MSETQRDLHGNAVALPRKTVLIHVDDDARRLCRTLKVRTPLDMREVATASLKISAVLVTLLDREDWEKILASKDNEEVRSILRTRI